MFRKVYPVKTNNTVAWSFFYNSIIHSWPEKLTETINGWLSDACDHFLTQKETAILTLFWIELMYSLAKNVWINQQYSDIFWLQLLSPKGELIAFKLLLQRDLRDKPHIQYQRLIWKENCHKTWKAYFAEWVITKHPDILAICQPWHG